MVTASSNFSRQFQGPYSLYIADATEAEPYSAYDDDGWPNSIVPANPGDGDWQLLGSGLISPSGIRVTPNVDATPVRIVEFDAPIKYLDASGGYTISVNIRDFTPYTFARVFGGRVISVAAVTSGTGAHPKYVHTNLKPTLIGKEFSLLLAGSSTLVAGGASLWFPKAVLSAMGEFTLGPENATELPLTFSTVEHAESTAYGHGVFLMMAP